MLLEGAHIFEGVGEHLYVMGVMLATHAVPLVANLLRRLCQAICLNRVARTVLKAKQCKCLGVFRAIGKAARREEIAVYLRPYVARIGQRTIEVKDGRAEGKRGGAELVETDTLSWHEVVFAFGRDGEWPDRADETRQGCMVADGSAKSASSKADTPKARSPIEGMTPPPVRTIPHAKGPAPHHRYRARKIKQLTCPVSWAHALQSAESPTRESCGSSRSPQGRGWP